jgi:hypothetical protein
LSAFAKLYREDACGTNSVVLEQNYFFDGSVRTAEIPFARKRGRKRHKIGLTRKKPIYLRLRLDQRALEQTKALRRELLWGKRILSSLYQNSLEIQPPL